MGRPVDDNYSRNQCSLMIRVDGDEIYMPLNFGMRADEIRDIYPYLLTMFNTPAKNPSLQFKKDDEAGKYKNLSEKERREMLLNMKRISALWYNRAEDSLLSIALRFAADIKLRGIEELRHLFETVRPLDRIEVQETAAKLTDEEVDEVLRRTGMITPTDTEFDPGDERDIPLGVAGGMGVDLYRSGAPEDYLSGELDKMESKLSMQDGFAKTLEGQGPSDQEYASKYEQGRKLTEAQAKGGILNMYPGDEGSVFDALDRADGLSSPEYDDDYQDFRTKEEPGPSEPVGGAYEGDEDGIEDGLEDAPDGVEDDLSDVGGESGESGSNVVSFGSYDGEDDEDEDPLGKYEEDGPPDEDAEFVGPDDDDGEPPDGN